MDVLAAFRTFVRIAETGSFSAVARETGATQSAVSRQISALETHLSARLIQRSTRSLTLTEDGRELLSHARAILDSVAETEATIGRSRDGPYGLVRLGCPSVFGRTYIVPHLGELLTRYPGLSIELSLADDIVDMIQDGLDLAIRVGEVRDASLVARRIGSTTSRPVASESYLAKHGVPKTPADLASHECVIFTRSPTPFEWNFEGPGGAVSVRVNGRFRSNGIESVLASVVAGHGIALVPLWMMRAELGSGAVKSILPDWNPKPRPIMAVYPSRRFLAPRTRAVIDFLVEEFRLDPIISAHTDVELPRSATGR